MPDRQFYTQEAAVTKASEIKTAFATSKLRLFKGDLSPNYFTPKSALVAAECDFDGYTAGGYPLTAWTGPLNFAGGGAVITSPMVNVAYGPAGDPVVTNMCGGWWVEDTSGDVRIVGIFDPPLPLLQVGDGFPIAVRDVEGVNAAPTA